MSDESIKTDDVAASAEPAPAAPAETAPASSDDPLDQLLAEWDQKYPQPGVNTSVESASSADDGLVADLAEAQRNLGLDFQQREQAWQSQLSQSQDQLRLLQAQAASANVANENQISQLNKTVQQLQQSLQQEAWRQRVERSKADFDALVKEEQAKLPPDCDEKFCETFLLAEAQRDPELARAWEGQFFQGFSPLERAELEFAIIQHGNSLMAKVPLIANEQQRALAEKQVKWEMQRLYEKTFMDPEHYRAQCQRYVQKSLDKMHEVANRPRVDRDITADHHAVAQAVRGGGKVDPNPPMPDLTYMSDKELNRFTKQNFGF